MGGLFLCAAGPRTRVRDVLLGGNVLRGEVLCRRLGGGTGRRPVLNVLGLWLWRDVPVDLVHSCDWLLTGEGLDGRADLRCVCSPLCMRGRR
jgi:hypothetical protein